MQRIAIVTGGSRGIGRAVAAKLAASGLHVVLTYRRNEADAKAVVQTIVQSGGSAVAVRLELESEPDIDALFDEHIPAEGRLEIVVASAAASAFYPVADLRPHHLERSWATNVRSFVLLSQRAVRRMSEGGRILVITSYGSIRAFPAYGAIGADKAALESWVRHMAAEFGPRGITVNAINAGLVDTDSLHHYYDLPGVPDLQRMIERIPLRRLGAVEDVANAVAFLGSAGAAYITGHVLTVDGGLTIVAPPFWSELESDPNTE